MRLARGTGFLFFVATLACMAGLAATYYYFVRTTTGQFIDESALVEAVEIHGPAGKVTTRFLDWLPTISLVMAAVVVLFVTVIHRRWRAAGIALAACVAANIATQVLKQLLPVRPDRGVETLELNSLPSGHTTLAASAAAAVFLMASPRWRPLAGFRGRQFRDRVGNVHTGEPVAPARGCGGRFPPGGLLHDSRRLAHHPHGHP